MHADKNNITIRRGERGASALVIIGIIFGVLILIFGLLMLIASLAFMADGEGVGLIVFCAGVGIVSIVSGILLIVLPSRLSRKNAQPMVAPAATPMPVAGPVPGANPMPVTAQTPPPTAANTPGMNTSLNGGRQIISREVIAGVPAGQGPALAVAPSAPEPAQAPATRGGGTADGTEEIAGLVARADNLFATLKDLVRHENASQATSRRHLVSMLEAAGLMQWDDAPVCEAGRLTRNHHFWIRANADDLSDEDYDRLIAIEAALSVNQDLGPLAATATVDESRGEVPSHLMRALSTQEIARYDLGESLKAAYPDLEEEDIPGEWLVRASFASDAECAITPFRVVYNFRVNVEEHTMAISLEVPRPRCMAIFTSEKLGQVALARSYALRLSVLLAEHAIKHSSIKALPRVNTVIVNCHERGSSDVILSSKLTEELLGRLHTLLSDGSALEGSAFPTSKDIRAEFGPDGWFLPIEPFLTLSDELVSPSWRFVYPELVDRPTSTHLRAVTGARTVEEFGINENASRIAAWDELSKSSWESTTEAVSALVACRDATQDISIIEACSRTIDALLAGRIDATDESKLGDLFIRGTALEDAVRTAEAELDESNGPSHPEAAIQALSQALSPIESVGAYLDDADTIYRYFGSIAERVRFDLDIDDHRRSVTLVPDAYYNALCNISIAYDELDRQDKALEYADELVRIAPASIHATMRKVRILEHQSRVFEAADLIKGILRFASTPHDAAICHYRLAFMEWKLGREDLAVACYQRALTWDTEIARQAREELDDLLANNDKLHRLSDDEAVSLLAREGIPLGCDESDKRRLLASAVLCTDEGIFWAARPLVGFLFGLNGDDVMMGIYRSLSYQE